MNAKSRQPVAPARHRRDYATAHTLRDLEKHKQQRKPPGLCYYIVVINAAIFQEKAFLLDFRFEAFCL